MRSDPVIDALFYVSAQVGAQEGEEAALEVGSRSGQLAESSVGLRNVSIKTGRQGVLLLRHQTPRPDERKLNSGQSSSLKLSNNIK